MKMSSKLFTFILSPATFLEKNVFKKRNGSRFLQEFFVGEQIGISLEIVCKETIVCCSYR